MSTQIPSYCRLESDTELTYLNEISQNREYNFKYICSDKIAVIRSNLDDGSLVPLHKQTGATRTGLLLSNREFDSELATRNQSALIGDKRFYLGLKNNSMHTRLKLSSIL